MKLLVTGGSGFIGSRLALAARREGHEVVVTGQTNSDPERARVAELSQAGVPVDRGSLQDPAYAASMTRGCEAVIHLAAAQHEANVADEYFYDVNVNGTQVLLDACKGSGVRRFVYGSTIGVYGESRGEILDEATPPQPMNVYGRSKLRAEEVVNSHRGGPEVSIVRISETYGPGDFRLLKLFRAIDRGRFFMIGSGENRRQMIHVEDLARGLLRAAVRPEAVGQTFVMAGAEVMTTREMVAHVSTALGRPARGRSAPLWPFLAAAIVFERTLAPLGIQPPLHRRRLDFFRKSFVFSTDKAVRLLDFLPRVPFAVGAAETAAWYRAQGLL